MNYGSPSRGCAGSGSTPVANNRSEKPAAGETSLADMFAPPACLLSVVSFEDARRQARDTNQFILVNIQDDAVFQSHTLNRDVWRNETIQEVLVPNFIFWQRGADSPQGKHFVQLYGVRNYPHISAIHPRTGRQLVVWPFEKFSSADDAICELIAFIEKQHSSSSSSSTSMSGTHTSPERNTDGASSQTTTPEQHSVEPTDKEETKGSSTTKSTVPSEYNSMNSVLGDLRREREQRKRQAMN